VITGLSHVSIVVPDLAAAAARLKAVYGLEVGAVKVNEEQGVRLAYAELGNARVELMEPLRPGSPVAKFLERNPKGGIHHFCLNVESVDAAAEAIGAHGVRVLGEGKPQLNVHGERIAFVHPADFLGALVELEETKEVRSD
jgi:methylmalonyl-CoA/ethylmalonyl-CoA epimerase